MHPRSRDTHIVLNRRDMLEYIGQVHMFLVTVIVRNVVESHVVEGTVSNNDFAFERALCKLLLDSRTDEHLLRRMNQRGQDVPERREPNIASDVKLGGEPLCTKVHHPVTVYGSVTCV